MSTARRRLFLGSLKLLNLGLMIMAFAMASALQLQHDGGGMSLASFFSLRVKLINFVIFCLILLAWHAILSLCGLYRSQRLASRGVMLAGALKATTLATLFCG